jgi:hypothetical protein
MVATPLASKFLREERSSRSGEGESPHHILEQGPPGVTVVPCAERSGAPAPSIKLAQAGGAAPIHGARIFSVTPQSRSA